MKRTVSQYWFARRAIWMASAVALLAVQPGCATNQEDDVARYRELADPGIAPDAGGETTAVSLVEAMRRTATLNERLAAQGERYVQALADRQRSAAALQPTFDLFSDVAVRENAGSDGVIQSNLGVSGQYRLLTGLSDLRNVDAADATIESRRWLILDLRESLLLETAVAYYETLRAERLVAVLESSVAAQAARLQEARARNEAGFARPLDVAQNEAQVSRTRTQLITAQRQVGEARATLSLLTGTDVRQVVLSDNYNPPPSNRSLDELLDLADAHRQDVLAARADAEAARSLVDAAIGQYAPSISINLEYFLSRGPDDSAAVIASLIQVRMPLLSAGRIEADVRSAWSVFRERVLDYRLRKREVVRDVETANLQFRSSIERSRELETQVRAANDALLLAEAAYQAGLGTNLEVVTAQDELLAAELEMASEGFTTKVASLSLRRACGLLSVDQIGAPLPEVEDRPEPSSPVLERSDESATRGPASGSTNP